MNKVIFNKHRNNYIIPFKRTTCLYMYIIIYFILDCVSASPGAAASNAPGPSLVSSAMWVGDREKLKSLENFSSWELLMTRKHKHTNTSSGKNSIYNEVGN